MFNFINYLAEITLKVARKNQKLDYQELPLHFVINKEPNSFSDQTECYHLNDLKCFFLQFYLEIQISLRNKSKYNEINGHDIRSVFLQLG